MITRDGVTYPETRDELLATGRWKADPFSCNYVLPIGWALTAVPIVIAEATAIERDRALVAEVAERTAENEQWRNRVASLERDRDAVTATMRAEIERLRAEAFRQRQEIKLGEAEVGKVRREMQREIERLRAQVPTRERVIEALEMATKEPRAVIVSGIEEGNSHNRFANAARLLGLDVREPRDPESETPTDDGATP